MDAARGDVPRERWIRAAIAHRLGAPTVQWSDDETHIAAYRELTRQLQKNDVSAVNLSERPSSQLTTSEKELQGIKNIAEESMRYMQRRTARHAPNCKCPVCR